MFSQDDTGTEVKQPENMDGSTTSGGNAEAKPPGSSPNHERGKVLMTLHFPSKLYTDRKISEIQFYLWFYTIDKMQKKKDELQ